MHRYTEVLCHIGTLTTLVEVYSRGVSWGGFRGLGPPGSPKGRQKERKKEKERKREGRKDKKRGQEGKNAGHYAVSSASRGSREENIRGAKLRKGRERRYAESMKFQVQAGAPGKKTSGAPN